MKVRKLKFITSNKGKFEELKSMFENEGVKLEMLSLDLPEIQEIDAKKIIKEKLLVAKKMGYRNIIVEDTSLYVSALKGLPGPLIKWFLQALGPKGVFDLIKNAKSKSAKAKTIIGFLDSKGKANFFEGVVLGNVVSPKGKNGFGWDFIFMPKGSKKTFAQMAKEEKGEISMRKKAFLKLIKFLKS